MAKTETVHTRVISDIKEKAIHVPLILYQEPWLSEEEAVTYRRLLYKIINEGKEIEDEGRD